MDYKYNKLYHALSEIVHGIDVKSIERYVNYVGVDIAIVLFQDIIDYCETNNLSDVSKDELNHLCRKHNLPLLFSAEVDENIINHIEPILTNDIDYVSNVKYISYSVGIIVFSEFFLYGLNLLLPQYNIFNIASPIPVLITLLYYIYNSYIKGVSLENVRRYGLFRLLSGKRD